MIVMYSVVNNLGGFLAPLILMCIKNNNPLEFRIPIYTQWAFLGVMLPIFLWLPETPCKTFSSARQQSSDAQRTLPPRTRTTRGSRFSAASTARWRDTMSKPNTPS